MTSGSCHPVTVSRRIAAGAEVIFSVLADPARHPEIDGSGMLRTAEPRTVVTSVGDVFTMRMHNEEWDDYLMDNQVIAFEANRRIGWKPTPGCGHPEADSPEETYSWTFDLVPDGPGSTVVTETYDCSAASPGLRAAIKDGQRWLESMRTTLARLDALCTD
jgi:hypothetical protein